MVKPKTAILLPSLNRPEKVVRCVNSLRGTTDWRRVDIKVMLDLEDKASERALSGMPVEVVFTTNRKGSIAAWNEMLGLFNNYSAYVAAADDLVFHQGWYAATMRTLQLLGGDGMVGFNDLHYDGDKEWSTHWLGTRDFLINHNGGVIYAPHYGSWWCDPEVNDRARAVGKYIWAKDAVVEHVHPDWGKATVDQTYTEATKYHAKDTETYKTRKANGFPDDFPPVLKRD